jgi:hypothetical protein
MNDDTKEMLYKIGGMGDPNGRYPQGEHMSEHVVFIKDEKPTTAYAMRTRVWDTMVQLHKDHYGESWEGELKAYKVVAQGLSEEHAEALVKIMKEKT